MLVLAGNFVQVDFAQLRPHRGRLSFGLRALLVIVTMAASLGPSWSLRTTTSNNNNHASSPRCLTVYTAPTTVTAHHGTTTRRGKDHNHPAASLSSVALFGTERGSLHFRNYPPLLVTSADASSGSVSSSSIGIGGGLHRTAAVAVDPSQRSIEPIEQINLQGAVKGAIVNIVPAQGCFSHHPSSRDGETVVSPPVFLLLVDDDHRGGEQQPRHHRLLLPLHYHYWRRPHPKKEAMLQTIPSGRMRLTWSHYGREHSKNSPLLLRLKLVVVLPLLLLRRLCHRRMLIFIIIINRVLDWDEK